LFSQSYGTGSGVQNGLGVSIPVSNQIFTQGSIQASQSPLAAAIQGNGFFVVSGASGQTLYTRDGDFTTNAQGVLETQTGETVQGWTATASGINTTGPTSSITLPTGQVLAPTPTQNFTLNANLDAQAVAGTSTGTFSAPMQVVDSLGNTHDLTVTFTQSSSSANTWNYQVTLPSGDLAGGTAGQQTSLLTTPGTITFNSNGTMSTTGGTAPVGLSINNLADGAANLNINWNLFDGTGNGTITNYAETSDLASSSQDGNQAAQLTSVAIQSGGQVVATYSNGQTKVQAQVAMASIENPNSLQNIGNNNFSTSSLTATPAVGVPQTGGRGQILGSSLESSNVDMATEFTHLIIYQSGYQAASRVISTVNNMNQDLFSLIH
jgi:flagellar hook protein FlgE